MANARPFSVSRSATSPGVGVANADAAKNSDHGRASAQTAPSPARTASDDGSTAATADRADAAAAADAVADAGLVVGVAALLVGTVGGGVLWATGAGGTAVSLVVVGAVLGGAHAVMRKLPGEADFESGYIPATV